MDVTHSVTGLPSRDFILCVCGINISRGLKRENKTKKVTSGYDYSSGVKEEADVITFAW